ncbi:MAG: hypothetical protein M1812_004713 [Candelaria pacifica]|nr:MAG: hypothetical protein M1812_004713 [Candelaria pacifica]
MPSTIKHGSFEPASDASPKPQPSMRISNMLNPSTKTSEFPCFHDGDVVISLCVSHVFYLHASVLRRNSTFFAEHLTEEKGAVLSSKARKEGITTRYRFQLINLAAQGNVGELKVVDVDSNGRSFGNLNLPENGNGKVPNPAYMAYENLFKAYYNTTPDINELSIATVLNDCMALVDVAEYLGSISIIQQTVDICLLRQGQVLFRSIAANALAWSDLAYRVRSPTILTEAVIHLVGQWNAIPLEGRSGLNPEVLKLCEAKVAELDNIKMAIELRVFGHYPLSVQRSPDDNNGRQAYSGNIYMWMCMSLFRQWFGQSLAENRHRISVDGGCQLYRQIASGQYLDRNALAGFHRYFPMSLKGMAVLENTLGSLKEDFKPFVEELLVNRSQMEINDNNKTTYLTCCVVKKSDLPWIKAAKEKAQRDRHDTHMGGMDLDADDDFDDGDYPVVLESAHNGSSSGKGKGKEKA